MKASISLLACLAASVTATSLAPRAGIPFRGPKVDPVHDDPEGSSGSSHGSNEGWNGGTAGAPPHVGGMAPENQTPEYEPASEPNACLKEGGECKELIEKGADLLKELISQLEDAIPTPKTSSSSSTTPGFMTSHITGYATGNSKPTLMPNSDVAQTVSLTQEQLALLNADEQAMLSDDPLCFFANVERQYESAASASPSPTAQPKLVRRGDPISMIQSAETATTSDSDYSTLPTSAVASVQNELFASYLPGQILSIYSPLANGSSVYVATSLTTCSGLDGGPSFVTPYVKHATPTNTYTVPASTGGSQEVDSSAMRNLRFDSALVLSAISLLVLVT